MDALAWRVSSAGAVWEMCTYGLAGEEPLKLTLCPKSFGYTGTELAGILEQHVLYPEFYDPDHVVLMLTPYNSADDLHRLEAG